LLLAVAVALLVVFQVAVVAVELHMALAAQVGLVVHQAHCQ
jgi:hypothetical protein